MDEYTAEAFANREDVIPVVAVNATEDKPSPPGADGARDSLKRAISPSRLKSRPQDISTASPEQDASLSVSSPSFKTSIQDRLFSTLLRQVVPTDDVDDDTATTTKDSSSSYIEITRPAFSLPTMTNNFRRFNARIGIVFVFQARMIRLFTWRTPTHTLSFLATYTFICLDPYLLVVAPLAIALFSIMIPAFTSRHPPPPPNAAKVYHQAYTGPALAPATTIKPASETSKDFFRNMRDLQNSMADFSNGHDALVSLITPATNFSDEIFSSQLFLYLAVLTTISFISAHLLPWRLIFLVLGWTFIISSHPFAQSYLATLQKKAETQTSLGSNDPTLKNQRYIPSTGIPLPATPASLQSAFTTFSEITLSSRPETREVEIFELQHRPLLPHTIAPSQKATEWQPHLFASSPYDPLSPSRISGDRPRGTRFFEDVEAPEGWDFAGKKWELDLEAEEWVNERLIVGVGFDVLDRNDLENAEESVSAGDERTDDDGGQLQRIDTSRRDSVNADFGGWVWDLPPQPGSGANRDDDIWLAYGDYELPASSKEEEKARKKKAKDKEHRKTESRDWEEATRVENRGRTGEWRRRRWVRLVKRRVLS
jgi:hypothetical protein